MTQPKFVRCKQCAALNEPRAVFCSRCGASLPGAVNGPPRRPLTGTSVAMGAALVLGLAIIALVLYVVVDRSLDKSVDVMSYAGQEGIPASTEPPATTAPTDTTTDDGSPSETLVTTTTEPPIMIRPKATVASSALEGTSTASFRATNLLDGDLNTAWIEGADGLGLGEWVRFDFSKPTVLARIDIANGYQKDAARFASNPRVKLISMQYSSGATQLVQLYDTEELQHIVPADEAIEWVKLVIVSVYSDPPETDDTTIEDVEVSEDTSLTEVHIYEKTD